MIPEIAQAANMAKDLVSPDCISWDNLETMYAMRGKDCVLAVIEKEMHGANNIYLAHLELARKAISQLP